MAADLALVGGVSPVHGPSNGHGGRLWLNHRWATMPNDAQAESVVVSRPSGLRAGSVGVARDGNGLEVCVFTCGFVVPCRQRLGDQEF